MTCFVGQAEGVLYKEGDGRIPCPPQPSASHAYFFLQSLLSLTETDRPRAFIKPVSGKGNKGIPQKGVWGQEARSLRTA